MLILLREKLNKIMKKHGEFAYFPRTFITQQACFLFEFLRNEYRKLKSNEKISKKRKGKANGNKNCIE